MHSINSYLKRQTSQELKGILWGASYRPLRITEECVVMICDILRERGDLDPESIVEAERALEACREARKKKQEKPCYFSDDFYRS